MQGQQARQLPRFIREFIGKGHQLEQKKRKRRKAQLQERALANRVIYLQKEQMKARKSLVHKKQELSKIIGIAQRQSRQKQKKEMLQQEREKQIEMNRQQNRIRRIIHRKNQEHSVHLILQRNNIDYKTSKKNLQEYQKRKHQSIVEDLTIKKNRYMTLNLMRDQGRSRIDSFFKEKNKQHNKLYDQKIKSQEQKAKQKQYTIKQLALIQQVMRKRLEESSLKVSQMDQILGNVSTQVKKRSLSKSSFDLSSSMDDKPTLITTIEGQLLSSSQNKSRKRLNELSEGSRVRKRRNSQISGQNGFVV